MRVLHTSDWHLGARLCDRDRTEEQKQFLQWLTETLEKEKIEILLVSGDIFDNSNPPNSAETLYYDFLCSIRGTGCRGVVITGGNHDSISKLNSPKALLNRLSIHVVGGAGNSPEECVIDFPGAVICAVPFLRERDIRVPVPGERWEDREISVRKGIAEYYGDVCTRGIELGRKDGKPVIAMGHLFVAGSESAPGLRDLYAGNLGAVDSGIFPPGVSYTALGHIHRAQRIGGRNDIRYCGSPLPMDFGEPGSKYVIIADFEGSELREARTLEVPVFRKLIRFKGTSEEVESQLEAFETPAISLWADAELEGLLPLSQGDVSLRLNRLAAEKGIDLLRIRVLRPAGENIIDNRKFMDVKDLDVVEVFEERCANALLSEEETEELMKLYRELLAGLDHED